MPKHSLGPFTTNGTQSPVRIVAADGDTIARVYLTDPTTKKRTDKHAANLALFLNAPEMAETLRSLTVKVANIAGEANSGRAVPATVLADACAEIAERLSAILAKIDAEPRS